jgi:hypothetical protein
MSRQSHFLRPLLGPEGGPWGLYTAEGAPVASELEPAFDSARRKRGLLGRSSLAPSQALIIAPCSGVHTFRMQFPIDVIYAARDGRVVKLRPDLRPGRISLAVSAFATVEMAAGTIARIGLRVGDRLVVR